MNPPMPITNILLAAATLLTLAPGLDMALVLRTATVEGKRQALQATLGINPGCLLWSPILIGATQSLSGFLRREKVIQWMDSTTGMIFVLFAARLAFSKR